MLYKKKENSGKIQGNYTLRKLLFNCRKINKHRCLQTDMNIYKWTDGTVL